MNDPHDPLKRAIHYHQNNEFVLAKNAYELVLAKEPENLQALNFLGALLNQMDNPDEGIQYIQHAIQLNPAYAAAHYNLSQIYHAQKAYKKAAISYANTLALQPDHREALRRYGQLAHRVGDHQVAMQSWLRLIRLTLSQEVGVPVDSSTDQIPALQYQLINSFIRGINDGVVFSLTRESALHLLGIIRDSYYLNRAHAYQKLYDPLSHWMKFSSRDPHDPGSIGLTAKIYNLLRFIYWGTEDQYQDMASFDEIAVKPFSRYIKSYSKAQQLKPRRTVSEDPRKRICYFLHKADPNGGFAIASVLYALMKGHHALNSDQFSFYFYCFEKPDPEFIAKIKKLNFTVRDLSNTIGVENQFVQIREQFSKDQIDIAIASMNIALSTFLFESRIAPIQLYWVLGFRYWGIEELDGVLIPDWVADDPQQLNVDPQKALVIKNPQDLESLDRLPSQDLLAAERQRFPKACTLIGNFGRLSKINHSFLELLRLSLIRFPQTHAVLAGTGDPALIEAFRREQKLMDRITIINAFVDSAVYASLIDIFLDSFPIISGKACFEAMRKNTPILHKISPEWGQGVITHYRDPELCVNNDEAYLSALSKLLNDQSYYEAASERSKSVLSEYFDLKRVAGTFEARYTELLERD